MPSIFEIGVSSVHPAPGAELLFLHSIFEVIRLGWCTSAVSALTQEASLVDIVNSSPAEATQ